MSDAPSLQHGGLHDDGPHEGPIRTPKQLILAVFFSFVIPIAAIVLLATYVTTANRPAAGSDGLGAAAVAKRIQPVGQLVVKDMSDPGSMKSGDQVFAAQCAACHAAGVAGAPKLGDEGAWAARIKQGYEVLLTSALKGKGAMGPQGGGDHSDFEIGRAVVYLTNKSGGRLPEPQMPAATAAAPAEAPAAPATAAAPTTADTPPSPATGAAPTPAAATAAAPAPSPTSVAAAPATAAPTAAAAAATGAVPALYTTACSVCHAAGVAGAPKLGDKAAWAPRLAAGIDGLTASVIKGKGAMPPRGGSAGSDADIKSAVGYMVGSVK